MRKLFLSILLASFSFSVWSETNIKAEYKELVNYFFAAARTGNVEVVDEYLNHGFPVNQRNNQTYTALMVAAYSGHNDIVTTLITYGADVCLQDKRGNTALMGALFKGEFQIAKFLYEHYSCEQTQKNSAGQTLEEFAEMFGQSKFIKTLASD